MATSATGRSLFNWALQKDRNTPLELLEITGNGMCSALYGCMSPEAERWNLLDAVQASAAFLDANGPTVPQPLRLFVAAGLHLLNADWGIDIRNPNVGTVRRVAR